MTSLAVFWHGRWLRITPREAKMLLLNRLPENYHVTWVFTVLQPLTFSLKLTLTLKVTVKKHLTQVLVCPCHAIKKLARYSTA